MTYRKKLIEVAMPLDSINQAAIREKHPSTRGHPRSIHLWWARRPLATCRAIIFATLVDDPSNDLPENEAAKARERLFRIVEELAKWENSTNEVLIDAAREEIYKSTKGHLPPILDPFCGAGSIPLEAQRLGLESYGSELNPIAVLITKTLIEVLPKFNNRPPINPEIKKGIGSSTEWKGLAGLASDVLYYGKWLNNRAWEVVGHLHPEASNNQNVVAWLWARTIKCPNPACGSQMPLFRTFWLSTKRGKEIYLEPIIDSRAKTVKFEIGRGNDMPPENDTSYNLVKRGDKWPRKVLHQNRSSTSSARRKFS